MRNRGFKLLLLGLAAAGGVAAWQKRNETPPTPPNLRPSSLRPSEPFMDPAVSPAAEAARLDLPAKGGTGNGDVESGTVPPPDPAEASTGIVGTPWSLKSALSEESDEDDMTAAEAPTAELPITQGPPDVDAPDVNGGPAEDAGVIAGATPIPLPDPPHGPFTTAPQGPADDLKRISGVGPKLEKMLNEQGITTFAQLASMTDDQVDVLQQRLPQFPGRIRRDNWVQQAAKLKGSWGG